MTRIGLALLFLTWPAGVNAGLVEVRSGEHVDFSRLVFEFGEEVSWQFGRFDKGYVLDVDGAARTYDLDEVFDFMPRSRILDVTPSGELVRLKVSCDCHGDAFEYRPGVLVIDIKDGPAPAHARFEAALSSDEIAQPAEPASSDASVRSEPNAIAPLEDRRSAAAEIFGKLPAYGPAMDGQADLRRALTGEIGRATTLGLVEVVSKEQDADTTAHSPAQVQVRNGFEQIARSPVVDHPARPGCLPDASFNLSAWGVAQDPVTAIGVISSGTGPQDGKSQNAETIAKAYLNLGFGAEAEQVLATTEEQVDDSHILRELARLIDDPSLGQGKVLRQQYSCDSAAMPWAVLAWGSDQPSASFDEAVLRRTFSEWPLWLRVHIAPALSARLMDAGYEETARSVRESVLRAQQPEEQPAEDTPNKPHADTEHAATDLPEVGLSNIASMTRRLNAAGPGGMDEEMLSAARALAFEAKGTDTGEALLDAYVDALGRAKLFDEALQELQRFSRSRKTDPTNLRRARNRLVVAMTDQASDGAFLSNSATLERAWLDTDVAMGVGVRLTKLGFSDQAKRFGMPPAVQEEDNQFADVAPVRSSTVAEQPSAVQSLHAGRKLLENSRELRDSIQAVLASRD